RFDRADDVVHALVAFIVGVVDAARVGAGGQPRVQVRQIAVVHERPVVVPIADNANKTVARGLENVAHHAVAAAVHDAGAYHDGTQLILGGLEHELFVGRSEGRQRARVDRRILGRRLWWLSKDPGARRVDPEAA